MSIVIESKIDSFSMGVIPRDSTELEFDEIIRLRRT